LKRRRGALHFDTDANMLFAGEEDERGGRWVPLGHVVPLDAPQMNQPIPKIAGVPYGGVRLMERERLGAFPSIRAMSESRQPAHI
jgi:hypothetical protein